METGYPRFFIHRLIVSLGERICARFGNADQMAMPFCCHTYTFQCERNLKSKSALTQTNKIHTAMLAVKPIANLKNYISWDQAELHVVLYPKDLFPSCQGILAAYRIWDF